VEIKLSSTSPLSFSEVKEGDTVTLKLKIGDPREHRSSTGTAKNGFLVFKGQLKIGMVPSYLRGQSGSVH